MLLCVSLLPLLFSAADDDTITPSRPQLTLAAHLPAGLEPLAAALEVAPAFDQLTVHPQHEDEPCFAVEYRTGSRLLRCQTDEPTGCWPVRRTLRGCPARLAARTSTATPLFALTRALGDAGTTEVSRTQAGPLRLFRVDGHLLLSAGGRWHAFEGEAPRITALLDATALLGAPAALLQVDTWEGGSGMWETARWLVLIELGETPRLHLDQALLIGRSGGSGSLYEGGMTWAGQGQRAREAPRGCLRREDSMIPLSRWPASSLDVVRASITAAGRLRLDRRCRFGSGTERPLIIEAPGELRLDRDSREWRRIEAR